MELFVADVFDYSGERPFIVGVYDTEEKAWDAIDIVIKQIVGVNPKTDTEARFHAYVTPIQLNGFSPACMEWCYSG